MILITNTSCSSFSTSSPTQKQRAVLPSLAPFVHRPMISALTSPTTSANMASVVKMTISISGWPPSDRKSNTPLVTVYSNTHSCPPPLTSRTHALSRYHNSSFSQGRCIMSSTTSASALKRISDMRNTAVNNVKQRWREPAPPPTSLSEPRRTYENTPGHPAYCSTYPPTRPTSVSSRRCNSPSV